MMSAAQTRHKHKAGGAALPIGAGCLVLALGLAGISMIDPAPAPPLAGGIGALAGVLVGRGWPDLVLARGERD
jgi:hypothetical protein